MVYDITGIIPKKITYGEALLSKIRVSVLFEKEGSGEVFTKPLQP